MSDDGWIPRWLGSVNRRFSSPRYILTLLYLTGMVPILGGFSVTEAAVVGHIFGSFSSISGILCSWSVRKTTVYANSVFKVNAKLHLAAVIVVLGLTIGAMSVLIKQLSIKSISFMIVWIALGGLLMLLRQRRLRVVSTPSVD